MSFLNKAWINQLIKFNGGMVQENRFSVMDDFRKGKFPLFG